MGFASKLDSAGQIVKIIIFFLVAVLLLIISYWLFSFIWDWWLCEDMGIFLDFLFSFDCVISDDTKVMIEGN